MQTHAWILIGSHSSNAPVLKLNKLIKKHAGWKRDRVETDWKEELDERKPLPTISWTILLLALTSWDKKLEIPISCPDAKACFFWSIGQLLLYVQPPQIELLRVSLNTPSSYYNPYVEMERKKHLPFCQCPETKKNEVSAGLFATQEQKNQYSLRTTRKKILWK